MITFSYLDKCNSMNKFALASNYKPDCYPFTLEFITAKLF